MGILRNPRTTQERRANGRRGLIKLDDYTIKFRPKRGSHRLPNNWCDIIRGDFCHKSWKRHRKNQYKAIIMADQPKKSFWDGLEKDGNRINTNHPVFQVGRFLYDAQVVHARLEKGEAIEPETIKLLCERYCQLVAAVGQLRAHYADLEREYDAAKEKIKQVFSK